MNDSELIQGVVKWFSREKGYGFITADENVDHYFSIRDVIGSTIPHNGSQVQFNVYKSEKGLQAKSIEILKQAEDSGRHVVCEGCKKQIVPRIVFSRGSPDYLICPFCGCRYKKLGVSLVPLILGALGFLVVVCVVVKLSFLF